MGNRDISEPIANQLFFVLLEDYKRSKSEIDARPDIGSSFNKVVPSALSAYPMTVNVWEAYLHEVFFSGFSNFDLQRHPMWEVRKKVDRWDLVTRTYILPLWVLGRSFDKSRQPFQDFQKLVQIRNSIVHFRTNDAPKNVIQDLAQRKITLKKGDDEEFAWTAELSSIECYRWALNTLVKMVHALDELHPKELRRRLSFLFNELE